MSFHIPDPDPFTKLVFVLIAAAVLARIPGNDATLNAIAAVIAAMGFRGR